MNKEKVLKELKHHRPGVHIYSDAFTSMPIKEWKEAGSPYVWKEVARYKEDTILLNDSGYGALALVIDSKVVDVGRDFVCSIKGDLVGLSEYYGAHKPALYKRV